MTINELLAEVDELKPNAYTDAQKVRWINVVEGRIVNEIIKTHLPNPEELPEEEIVEDNSKAAVMKGIYIDGEFKGYTELTNIDTELIAVEPYTELYKYYLFSMIDMHNEEYDRYQNSALMFNETYQSFANYWNRTHRSSGPVRFIN